MWLYNKEYPLVTIKSLLPSWFFDAEITYYKTDVSDTETSKMSYNKVDYTQAYFNVNHYYSPFSMPDMGSSNDSVLLFRSSNVTTDTLYIGNGNQKIDNSLSMFISY